MTVTFCHPIGATHLTSRKLHYVLIPCISDASD